MILTSSGRSSALTGKPRASGDDPEPEMNTKATVP